MSTLDPLDLFSQTHKHYAPVPRRGDRQVTGQQRTIEEELDKIGRVERYLSKHGWLIEMRRSTRESSRGTITQTYTTEFSRGGSVNFSRGEHTMTINLEWVVRIGEPDAPYQVSYTCTDEEFLSELPE